MFTRVFYGRKDGKKIFFYFQDVGMREKEEMNYKFLKLVCYLDGSGFKVFYKTFIIDGSLMGEAERGAHWRQGSLDGGTLNLFLFTSIYILFIYNFHEQTPLTPTWYYSREALHVKCRCGY